MTFSIFQDTWFRFGGAEAVAERAAVALRCSSVIIGLSDAECSVPLAGMDSPRILATTRTSASHGQKLTAGVQAALEWEDSPPVLLAFHHHFGFLVRRHVDQLTVYYVHTPTRFLWAPERVPWELEAFSSNLIEELRERELESARNATALLANSMGTASAVETAYGRSAKVVYPPVIVSLEDERATAPLDLPSDFFLTVTRLVPGKMLDRIIGTTLPIPWLIVGGGRESARLKTMASEGVWFLGPLDRTKVTRMMARARAYISPGIEDFGLAAAEALCYGTPLIAGRGSGVLEIAPDEYSFPFDPTSPSDFQRSATRALDASRLNSDLRSALLDQLSPSRFARNLVSESPWLRCR